VVSFTLRPLYPREKNPRYPLYRRLGGLQSRSGRLGEVKILDPYGDSNSNPSVVQPVASRYTDYTIPATLTTQNWNLGRTAGGHSTYTVQDINTLLRSSFICNIFLRQVSIFNEVKGKSVSLSKISYEVLICFAAVELHLQYVNTNAETVFMTRPSRLVHLWKGLE
jgi:hypothetical protein